MATELTVHAIHQGDMRVRAKARDHAVQMDYPRAAGDETVGATPLELILASLAGCAANSVALLLRRDQRSFENLEVSARGLRREEHPTVITEIHLEFLLTGEGLEPAAVQKVIDLAESRICPVWAMLKGSTAITSTLRIEAP
jgi:putative redox protein